MGQRVLMGQLRPGSNFVQDGIRYLRLPDHLYKKDAIGEHDVNALCMEGEYFGKVKFIPVREEVIYVP